MTTRHRYPIALAALAAASLVGATACGATTDRAATDRGTDRAVASQTAELPHTEELALVTAGFETGAIPAEATPTASAGPDAKERRNGLARRTLRKNTLHGEVTVQTKKGVKTILVQRGAVTAVSAAAITVKSSDGFTEQWTFGEKVRVRVAKEKAQVSDLKVGAQVGIAGAKDGEQATARLVIAK